MKDAAAVTEALPATSGSPGSEPPAGREPPPGSGQRSGSAPPAGGLDSGDGSLPPVLRVGAAVVDGPMDAAHAGVLAGMFKALGDPVRLRLLSMIASTPSGEICVCDLSGAFPLTGPTISHHLRILREAGLVGSSRRGTWVYYRPVPAALAALAVALDPQGRRSAVVA